MRVLKFGGTSVANAERIRDVAKIVLARAARGPVVTVVSAMGGTTETLDRAVFSAASGEDHRTLIHAVAERHRRAVEELAPPSEAPELSSAVNRICSEARDRLDSVALLGEASPRVRDSLLAVGEELSSLIVAVALRQLGADARAVSARGLVRTDSRFGNARVDFAATEPRVRQALGEGAGLAVVTGFIASDEHGTVTTLGRGGSDYTAAILGVALGAARVEIWTDVDGVMSADPRLVPEAFPILELSYDELIELGRLGAKVVYPPTVELARNRSLPLAIKNTFRPDAPGTLVTRPEVAGTSDSEGVREVAGTSREGRPEVAGTPLDGTLPEVAGTPQEGAPEVGGTSEMNDRSEVPGTSQGTSQKGAPEVGGTSGARRGRVVSSSGVRSLCSSGDVAVLRVGGAGLATIRDLGGRVISSLARAAVPKLQAVEVDADASVSVTLRPERVEDALAVLEEEFSAEHQAGRMTAPTVEGGLVALHAVGPGIGAEPQLLRRLFAELALFDIPVPSVSQAASEHRLTIAVGKRDQARALRAAHRAFFARPAARAEIFVAGVGAVGSALLEHLAGLEPVRSGELAVVGVADSQRVALSPRSIPVEGWREALEEGQPMQLEALANALAERPAPHRIFVDCTASSKLGRVYPRMLRRGVSVVTANRVPLAGPLGEWQAIERAAQVGGTQILLGASVAPGLALLPTVEDLTRTGEGVARLEGVLSGSIAFILARIESGAAFSDAVREAVDRGLAEPDPTADLSGMDLARKLCVLARAAGWAVEMDQIEVDPLVPLNWPGRPPSALWSDLLGLDTGLEVRRRRAAARGRRLRYVAQLEAGGKPCLRVALEAVGEGHPLFDVAEDESLVTLSSGGATERFWCLRGPAAGPAATASALAADVLRAASLRPRLRLTPLTPSLDHDDSPPLRVTAGGS